MEGEVGSHPGPAQAGSVDDRVIQFPGGGHTVVHKVEYLPPQRLLETVRQVTGDLVADYQRVHVQVVVNLGGPLDNARRGPFTAHYLAQREQVYRVEGMADDDPLGMRASRCDPGGQQAR